MFKEFGLILMGFFILYWILKWVYYRNVTLFQKILIGLLLFSVVLSTGYNLRYIVPNFNYENVSLGDCKENLFTYKDDSEFQWQILFPVLKERKVYLDDTGTDYDQFFKLYSNEVEKITIDQAIVQKIEGEKEVFTTNIRMTLIDLLNYAFEPYDSTRYEDSYPFLRINIDSLKGENELVAIVDANRNIYLMSKSYYDAKEALK